MEQQEEQEQVELRVYGPGFQDLGLRAYGFRVWSQGLGFEVLGWGAVPQADQRSAVLSGGPQVILLSSSYVARLANAPDENHFDDLQCCQMFLPRSGRV